MEQTSILNDKPRETKTAAENALALAARRRITEFEQRRLYEAEMRGEKPLISGFAYRAPG